MEKFIKVSAKEDDSHEDVPLNDDGALALSILRKYFPRAVGLKYFSDADISHEIDLDDDRFYPPLGLWGDLTYHCICLEEPVFTEVKGEPLCIEDIRCIDEDEKNADGLNMVHIKISPVNQTKKKSYKPKGKYKKRKPHKCDICGKNFRNESYVETHKLIHTGEKPHNCTHCEERFARQDLLRIHVKTVHGISCRRQHTPIQRSPTSKRDKRRMDEDFYYAEVKKRKYTRRKSKNGEGYDEEEPKNYQCVNCLLSFPTKVSLRKHPCATNQTQFTCEECSQTFTKLSKLRLHLYKCHADQKLVKEPPAPLPSKTELSKSLPGTKSKGKCKYVKSDVKQELSDLESSDEDVSYWDCVNENETTSYVPKCDCVPNFNIVHYIEAKIPPEILTKFRYCKQNNIPWTGFLGYSALYKFWARIVNDNPYLSIYTGTTEVVQVLAENSEESEKFNEVTEYVIAEDDEVISEATTENTNFLKSIDDLVTFN